MISSAGGAMAGQNEQEKSPLSPEMQEILADSQVEAITAVRRRAADKAQAAQSIYNRNGIYFILAGGVATIAGALILLSTGGEGAAEVIRAAQEATETEGTELPPDTLAQVQVFLAQKWVRGLLFVLEVLALGFAAYCAEILRSAKSDVTWISERREAEAGRIKRFDTIMACAQARDGGTGVQYEAQAFAYFLDEQLGTQIRYHSKKEVAASKGAWTTTRIGAAIAAIVAAIGASSYLGEWWIIFGAFVGVIAPVLMQGLSKYRDLKLDRERSEASANMWKLLREIEGRKDLALAAFAKGDAGPGRQMIADTHAAMKAENEAWMPTKLPI